MVLNHYHVYHFKQADQAWKQRKLKHKIKENEF